MVKALCLALALLSGGAQAACRQALQLGLDISSSVDAAEYRLQLDGLAAALLSPQVMGMALSTPGVPVYLSVFEWSGAARQRQLIGWTPLRRPADLQRVAASLRAAKRGGREGSTAIGSAMGYAAAQFQKAPGCWSQTLDLSGDGKNNDGPAPEVVRQSLGNVTINGLVIGADLTVGRDERQMALMDLSAYYRRRVIHGPAAFIEVALGFKDYERAMERKLLRELETLVVGGRIPAVLFP